MEKRGKKIKMAKFSQVFLSSDVELDNSINIHNTVNPLYNGTHYNSKILYNIILISQNGFLLAHLSTKCSW